MSGFGNFGARAYTSVGVETGVVASDPHTLVTMLYDGALEALHRATGCIQTEDLAGKTRALSQAGRIIDEGLRASLDHEKGGEIASNLDALYDYMCRRILVGSVENDQAPLSEVINLLDGLREAWISIKPQTTAAA